jgi:hypothetical protein
LAKGKESIPQGAGITAAGEAKAEALAYLEARDTRAEEGAEEDLHV